jgi:hypothetical protein
VPRVEVRCPLPCPEATGVTIQVSSPSYWRPLVRNRQIHKDLGVPLFADDIRTLTASFDSKLADVGNPLARQLGRYLTLTEGRPRLLTRGPRAAGQSRPSPAIAKSTKRIAFGV